ncbi:MAG: hypothetical protein KVP17_004652 [Porospora cf. gigantea B]|uniref:uncharacterized protein n=1 Tax=Porospora cf. gigantea B TaxID=2853592 RepID=UPI003571FAAF|nr:MAG: hypothetical protein KVP17_004652 [Porospora cf. gigantea B]
MMEKLHFRNYRPQTECFKPLIISPAEKDDIENEIRQAMEKIVSSFNVEQVLNNVAPESANSDLKRNLQRKLGKLDLKTQRAFEELIWQQKLTDHRPV